jgi:hypothetical protein
VLRSRCLTSVALGESPDEHRQHGGINKPNVDNRSCRAVPSADHPAYFNQLAATVKQIGRLSA